MKNYISLVCLLTINVTEISNYAFYNTIPPAASSTFTSVSTSTTLFVPIGSKNAYTEAVGRINLLALRNINHSLQPNLFWYTIPHQTRIPILLPL